MRQVKREGSRQRNKTSKCMRQCFEDLENFRFGLRSESPVDVNIAIRSNQQSGYVI